MWVSRQMHILFLTHYFPPEVNAPASRTYEHCKRWVEAGHKVTVITCAPNAPSGKVYDGYKNRFIAQETIDGINVVRVWSFIAPNSGFLKRIINFLSSMFMMILYVLFSGIKYDLHIATSPQFFTGWAGVVLKWFRRKPFLLEIRDIWPESILTVGAMKKSIIIRFLEKMEIWMYRAADHIVTVGNGYKENIAKKGVSPSKIDVVTNGVSLELFDNQNQSTEFRDTHKLPETKFICSYIGTIGMAHGLDVILHAAEKLRKESVEDVEFWIVGDGARRSELETMAIEKALENVRFLGRLPKEDMPKVIASSDAALVHLNKTDLFSTVIPSKLFEFMAMELPIIMGVEGESRQLVLDACAGEVMEPECAEDLIRAIQTIRLNGKNHYAGRNYVAEHFNRDCLAQKMLNIVISIGSKSKN